MAKVSFRIASASRRSVFGVQTSTARKTHRSAVPVSVPAPYTTRTSADSQGEQELGGDFLRLVDLQCSGVVVDHPPDVVAGAHLALAGLEGPCRRRGEFSGTECALGLPEQGAE